MARIHLFELEDQKWFPSFIRNYGTDFLRFMSSKTALYKPIIPLLKKVLQENNIDQIIDLCSGGGGGMSWINQELLNANVKVNILLTDYYPNIPAFELMKNSFDNIDYVSEAIDVRDVPAQLEGLRTLFIAFHHFRPSDAKKILQNAVDSQSPIAIFEVQERSIPSILAMLFSPIIVLLTTPFIRPFKIGRIMFTYLIPIVPLFVLWDGMVSALRTYSVKEMNGLISQLDNQSSFSWEVKRMKTRQGLILYLIGTKLNNQ